MTEDLMWQAGKFVYARGSDVPLHFMPLQKFSLEIAQDLSLIVALRMGRIEQQDALLNKIEIAKWRDALALDIVSEIVSRNLAGITSIVDVGGFSGLQFEEIKARLVGIPHNPEYKIYYPGGLKKHVFDALHFDDGWKYVFIDDLPSCVREDEIVIANCAAGIRYGHPVYENWEELVLSGAPNIVLVLNVSDADSSEERTTVFGQNTVISPLSQVMKVLKRTPGKWKSRRLAKHDHGFFLPGSSDVGLLIASNLENVDLAGFRSVDRDTNG